MRKMSHFNIENAAREQNGMQSRFSSGTSGLPASVPAVDPSPGGGEGGVCETSLLSMPVAMIKFL